MAAGRLHLPSPVRGVISPRMETTWLTRCTSLRCSTSHMYTTPRIQSPWAHATVSCRHAIWADMLWRAGTYPLRTLPTTLCCRLSPRSCHLGRSIVYDTVSNLSWSVDIRTHGIVNVIENLLSKPWAPSEEIGREVPEPIIEDDCVVGVLLWLMCPYDVGLNAVWALGVFQLGLW